MSFFLVSPDQISFLVGTSLEELPVPLAAVAVPASLVKAVIVVESGGNTWAFNPEPKWKWFWDCRRGKPFRAVTDTEVASEKPPKDFLAPVGGVDPDAEWWGQQASYGLMQPMGAVARENGFTGKFLSELHDPAVNIAIGVRHLANYARRYLDKYGWPGVLRAYNGGPYACLHKTNPEYVAKITKAHGGYLPHAA